MDKNPSTATVKTPSSSFTGDVWLNPVFGGTAENMMCHYAILDASGDGEATTWLEPVTDGQYLAAHRTAGV
jgi:hypothetical protein